MSNIKKPSSSILSQWKKTAQSSNAVKKVVKERPSKFLASEGQQRLYFLDQLHRDNPVYNLTEIWTFDGPLNVETFEQALLLVGKYQDLLRATFHLDESQIQCHVSSDFKPDITSHDLSKHQEERRQAEFNQISKEVAQHHFALEQGPLVKVGICRMSPTEYRVVINIHHIISDKWSMRVFRASLSNVYQQLSQGKEVNLQEHTAQFYDRTIDVPNKEGIADSIDYWKKKLQAPLSDTSLSGDIRNDHNASHKGKYATQSLSEEISRSISAYCKANAITPFVFFLSVYKVLIAKYTQLHDVIIGTPISTRTKPEYESIIGFFNDTLVLRSQIDVEAKFSDIVQEVKRTVFDAFQHKEVGFQTLLSEVNPERRFQGNPLFQMMFLYHQKVQEKAFHNDVRLSVSNFDMGVAKFDFTLYVEESSGQFEITSEYATDLYSEEYVDRLHTHYTHLISQVLASDATAVGKIDYLSSGEKASLISLGTASGELSIPNNSILERIATYQELTSVALSDGKRSISYVELHKQTNQIANYLINRQLATGFIGILLDQSIECIVAMIGVMKAGCAYLPLDRDYPESHIAHAIDSASVQCLISSEETSFDSVTTVLIDDMIHYNVSDTAPEIQVTQDSPAYLIFTSGSTGRPNGVVVNQGNLLNSTLARFEYYDSHPKAFLLVSSVSFDSSVAGIYWTLLNGGTIVIPGKDSIKDTEYMSQLLAEEGVTHSLLIPSLYQVYLEYLEAKSLSHLEVVILAGETLTPSIISSHFAKARNARLYNEYGPTEATVWTSAYEVKEGFDINQSVPIGRPVLNNTVYVLDDNQNLVPQGMVGELYVAGRSVTSGYLDKDSPASHKFTQVEINGQQIEAYRTGDLVSWNPDGNLRFIGRTDHQVKIRGHRVELGEIDAKLQLLNPSIQSMTIYQQEQQYLVTYLVADQEVDTEQLRSDLQATLPRQYWPDHFVQLDAFPRLANGKVNGKELQRRQITKAENSRITAPSKTNDNALLSIWQEVLNDDSIGIHDNFFDVGGDSIHLIRIVAQARKSGINITAKDIYSKQTVAALSPKENASSKQVELKEFEWNYLPVSPIQAWFFERFHNAPEHWLQGYDISLKNSLQLDKIKAGIQQLIESDQVFHSCFVNRYGVYQLQRQRYDLEDFIDVVGKDVEDTAHISLEEGPLLKVLIYENNGKVYSIKILMHHLITDAVSWHHIIDRLQDILKGNPKRVLQLTDGFYRWTHEINVLAQTTFFDSDIEYWNDMPKQLPVLLQDCHIGLEADAITETRRLPSAETHQLIGRLQQYGQIKINEAIIAAFLLAYYQVTDEGSLTLMVEGHGRDIDFLDVDLTESVGWFTSYFPVHYKLADVEKILDVLIDVKEQSRVVPKSGLAYGPLRYLSQKLNKVNNPVITINHLGDRVSPTYEIFESVEFISDAMRSPQSEREALIEINTHVEQGELVINCSYDSVQLDQSTMVNLCNHLVQNLRSFSDELKDMSRITSPSDYGFVCTNGELEVIKEVAGSNPTAILPLVSTQSALLFHHLQAVDNDQGQIEAEVMLDGKIDHDRLQQAWNILVETHEILRSFFVWDRVEQPYQVVVDSIDAKVEFVDFSNISSDSLGTVAQQHVEDIKRKVNLDAAPIHGLICFKHFDTQHRLVFICHHIFIDGWSTNLVFRDLLNIYEEITNSGSQKEFSLPRISEWQEEFNNLRNSSTLKDFWSKALKDTTPSLLKSDSGRPSDIFLSEQFTLSEAETTDLISQSKSAGITTPITLMGVWSWLLSNYLGQSTSTLGMILSGRSLPIDGMDEMVGMFSTVLPLIHRHDRSGQIDFGGIQKSVNAIMPREAVNIEDIHGLKFGQRLYDTLLIIENFMTEQDSNNQVQYSQFKSKITSLMPLCIVVVPGPEMKIRLRYNTRLYSATEISSIADDIKSVVTNLDFNGKVATIKTSLAYQIPKQISVARLESSDQVKSSEVWHRGNTIEESLLSIWQELFASREISVQDNFFEIGGTSLLAVRIFNTINERLGINASPILLLKNKTIEQLANALDSDAVSSSWDCLYPLSDNGDEAPLFCFHAGEGHIMFYNELAQQVTNRPVYGIQPVGLDGQEIEFGSIEEMASYYLSKIKEVYPSGPYHLLGTCFSNAVTFEIARMLKDDIGGLFIIDSPPPYFKELSKLKKWLNWVVTFNIPKLVEAGKSFLKYSDWQAPTDEQELNLFNTGKRLRKIMSTYRWSPQDVQLTLIRSSENSQDKFKSYHIDNWTKLTKKALHVKEVNGKHLSIFQESSATEMADIINAVIDNAK